MRTEAGMTSGWETKSRATLGNRLSAPWIGVDFWPGGCPGHSPSVGRLWGLARPERFSFAAGEER